MGASSSKADTVTAETLKTSYYTLLDVERTATADEIKRAYRSKALSLHPDRNYGDEDRATKIFADVQAAYEVLCDPQERAWYDAHEGSILRGEDVDGEAETQYEANVRVTTTDDIVRMMKKFNRNVDFSDSPSGFFGYLREVFAQLALEEQAAARMQDVESLDYPPFGHKNDLHEDVVKTFYSAWAEFYTTKTFAWKDKWQPSHGRDRFERRFIEKENKKLREEGVRDFNEAVRALVAFVKKRDPRWQPVVQSDQERQKALRASAAEQAAKARAENLAKLDAVDAIPEWAKVRGPEDEEMEEEEEEEIEEFECVACRKTFRSERQFEAHEKSKKHQKAIQALKRQMRKDNANLHLEESESSGIDTPVITAASGHDSSDEDNNDDESVEHTAERTAKIDIAAEPEETSKADDVGATSITDEPESHQESASSGDTEPDIGDDEYASREEVERRLGGDEDSATAPDTDEQRVTVPKPKIGMAKLKKAKKAAKAADVGSDADAAFVCQRCSAGFPSKTKLFKHIEEKKHAAVKTVPGAANKGRKNGKKG